MPKLAVGLIGYGREWGRLPALLLGRGGFQYRSQPLSE